MKNCKNCEKNEAIKYSKYTSGDFCCRKCARAFSTKENRAEINNRISVKLKGVYVGVNHISKENRIEIWKKHGLDIHNRVLLNADYNTLSYGRLKKRIVIEQNYCCNNCKLSEWLNTPIPLELEHIDGNHYNNERTNLEALCPNCHSLTPTWRGRNKKNYNRNRIDDETLLTALLENNFNMRQALISVGLAAKGGNYSRCHKLKQEYEEIHRE